MCSIGSIEWVNHCDLAAYDWKPTLVGENYLQCATKKGFLLAIVDKVGAWIINNPIWNKFFNPEKYKSQIQKIELEKPDLQSIPPHVILLSKVIDHDDLFKNRLTPCPYISNLYFVEFDGYEGFATVVDDKAFILQSVV